ncbi:hypothetical protein, partial [Bacillus velezensis]|uniref:hypothetical protein n=1 Tax=Bacillus velezensis TaxID=492670 RepID=UPI001C92C38C
MDNDKLGVEGDGCWNQDGVGLGWGKLMGIRVDKVWGKWGGLKKLGGFMRGVAVEGELMVDDGLSDG